MRDTPFELGLKALVLVHYPLLRRNLKAHYPKLLNSYLLMKQILYINIYICVCVCVHICVCVCQLLILYIVILY